MIDRVKTSALRYFQQNSKKIVLGVVVAIVLILAYLLFLLVDHTLNWIVPKWVADTLTVILAGIAAFQLCRILAFPGSTWLWRRYTENAYMKAFAVRTAIKLEQLELIVQVILAQKPPEFLLPDYKNEISLIRQMINSLNYAFRKMKNEGSLSSYQDNMFAHFSKLQNMLSETRISSSDGQINVPLWDSLDNGSVLYIMIKNPNVGLSFVSESLGLQLLVQIRYIKTEIESLTKELPFFDTVKRWVFNDSLGSLDQMRVDLETRYNAQRLQIPSYDQKILDCMFILGKAVESIPLSSDRVESNRTLTESEAGDEQRGVDIGPTILFCNPNAGIYEFMYFENDWIDFYVNRGINVMLWNYRGYGRSESFPTLSRIIKDGDVLVDYLRNTMNIKRMGIHGVSMGGLVATYLANTKMLDFLVADRTFSSLVNVVTYGYHWVVAWLFVLITWWKHSSCPDYIETKCYKVLTFDPKDEVIPSLASLTFGVSREILHRKYLHDHDRLFGGESSTGDAMSSRVQLITKSNTFLMKKYPVLAKLSEKLPFVHNFIVSWILRQECSNYVDNYHLNILSTNDYNILYFALKRIFKVIIDASKLGVPDGGEARFHEKKEQMANVSFYKQEVSMIHGENVLEELEEDMSPGKTPLKDLRLFSSNEEEYKVSLENDEDNEEIRRFVLNVFSLMELIDSAGVTLEVIFSNSSRDQNELFKNFLVNLEIWGSFLPVRVALKPDTLNEDFFHKLALFKLGEFIKKTEGLIAMERKSNAPEIIKKILGDLEVMAKKFRTIRERVKNNVGIKGVTKLNTKETTPENTSKLIGTRESNNTISELNPSPDSPSTSTILEVQQENNLSVTDLRKQTGYLIPLSCGHNGNLSQIETLVFEKHLTAVGYLK